MVSNNDLEFNIIQARLKVQAQSTLGRQLVAEISLSTQISEVRELLLETNDAYSLIVSLGNFPIGDFADIRPQLSYAQKGGSLNPKTFLEIARVLELSKRTKAYIQDWDGESELSSIRFYFENISLHKDLEKKITTAILSETEISDNASPNLRAIRREKRKISEKMRARLESLAKSSKYSDILREPVITIRDGRFVLPVKVEHMHKMPGIVHDRSKSSTTVFIEPAVIIEMDGELKKLEIDEAQEIERILYELSVAVGEVSDELASNVENLASLDFIFAKARLAMSMDAIMPELTDTNEIDLHMGRHPLIDAAKVIPTTLSLGYDYTSLIITGPNTGGKTVTLKTVGLFLLMLRAGLFVPAGKGTKLPIVDRIYADIGDEQSIEQSLSTFSSHMKNIIKILQSADRKTLCLLDELGAGTNPEEGAALGVAILEELKARGALVMATTHYTELKKYALATPGVQNASMEFDIQTLSPTYKLKVGAIGSSNAFDISLKLGIGRDIVARAKNLINEDALAFENVIDEIEGDKINAKKELDTALDVRLRAQAKEKQLDKRLAHSHEEADKILTKANEKALQMLESTKKEIEESKREIKAILAHISEESDRGASLGKLNDQRKKLENISNIIQESKPQKPDPKISKPLTNVESINQLRVGDKVRILGIDETAEIIKLPKSTENDPPVELSMGAVRLKKRFSELGLVEGFAYGKKPSKSSIRTKETKLIKTLRTSKTSTVSTQIDVHGMNLDDAILAISKFLDDAILVGLENIMIIHGLGAGILKNGINEYLSRQNYIKSKRFGNPNEGGQGVTIVSL